MPSLRQLEYLVALAQEQHFRRAADRVHVTQPTLSAQIQQLEKRLGAPLLERGGRGVLLTPLGREIVARAQVVLAQMQDIRELARSSQHGRDMTIRVGVPPTLGPYLLPHIVPRLHGEYPSMKLYVREAKPAALVAGLLAGDHDAVIVPMPVVHSDLSVAPLFLEPLRLVCAPEHRFAAQKTVARSDLAGENVLAMESGHHLHDQVSRICEEFGAQLLRDYEGTSLDTLRQMVGMGVGLAFLPALYVRSEVGDRDEIAVLNIEAPNLTRRTALMWRSSSVHTGLFNEIAELIRGIAKDNLSELLVLET